MFNKKNIKNKIINHLLKDVIKIDRKTIFINPFLYWRRFDENTNFWLRETGQISAKQIFSNRNRFFPELDWNDLSEEEKLIKDATVEMFIKTMELITVFHPQLNSEQLLEVERKMLIQKKISFEKWVKKSFAKKARLALNEKRKLQINKLIRSWKEWLSLENTQQAFLPIIVVISISLFLGWSFGISKNSCNPYFEENLDQSI